MAQSLQRLCLAFWCAACLSACAPTGYMADTWLGKVWPFGASTKGDITDLDAAFAARARELLKQNEARLEQLRSQQGDARREADSLSLERQTLAKKLQAEREAAFLVRVDGGHISLNKLDNLAACAMKKSTMAGAQGAAKDMKPPMTSMFSVGSVSPYAPHHVLMSKCLAARNVPKL